MRKNDRSEKALRTVSIEPGFSLHAEGSCLITVGNTKVICTASVDEKVPPFLRNTGKGWVTAEYSMLPRATDIRNQRESTKGKVTGRTMEIQRLIGRALRSIVDLEKLGERTIWLDCDVLQADGGTRTASITGAYVALADAVTYLLEKGLVKQSPLLDSIAAISVGKIGDEAMVDLDYSEDSKAEVDMNLVMTGSGRFVEIQGTAEGETFDRGELDKFLTLGELGIQKLKEYQQQALQNN